MRSKIGFVTSARQRPWPPNNGVHLAEADRVACGGRLPNKSISSLHFSVPAIEYHRSAVDLSGMISKTITLALCGSLLIAAPARALPPLSENPVIVDGLIAVGLALEISEKCAALDARSVRGLLFLNSLRTTARKQGYTDAQIEAYVDDKAEKSLLEDKARAYLAQKGATGDASEAYCRVGRAEISAGSQTGRLLRD
jgi:hypothetical protein